MVLKNTVSFGPPALLHRSLSPTAPQTKRQSFRMHKRRRKKTLTLSYSRNFASPATRAETCSGRTPCFAPLNSRLQKSLTPPRHFHRSSSWDFRLPWTTRCTMSPPLYSGAASSPSCQNHLFRHTANSTNAAGFLRQTVRFQRQSPSLHHNLNRAHAPSATPLWYSKTFHSARTSSSRRLTIRSSRLPLKFAKTCGFRFRHRQNMHCAVRQSLPT